MKTIPHLLGSERSMLVPNLMIFPDDFSSGLEEEAMWKSMLNKKLKWELSGETDSVFCKPGRDRSFIRGRSRFTVAEFKTGFCGS